ncbi:MAG: class I SAM-dependent methyltransferase [Dysgonomonas sp.]
MKTTEESVVIAMDGLDTAIFPFIPYILQDFEEIGTSLEEVITLLQRNTELDSEFNILDLGCGKGGVSIRLSQRFKCHCLGLDAIKEFIAEANEKVNKLGINSLCEFKVADIREEIKSLGKYDVIILGAIGQVYGNYYETISTLLPHLKHNGVIIINDAYIETPSDVPHPSVLNKEEMLKQIEQSNMKIVDEIRADEETYEDNNEDLQLLTNRCNELIAKYPEKSSLFNEYIDNQSKEYSSFETNIICSIMILKRK